MGFAKRANKLTLGRRATVKALKKGKIALVILAKDAGEAIRREIVKLSEEANIKVFSLASKRDMGEAIGRESCSVLGLMDSRMAQGVMEIEQDKGL